MGVNCHNCETRQEIYGINVYFFKQNHTHSAVGKLQSKLMEEVKSKSFNGKGTGTYLPSKEETNSLFTFIDYISRFQILTSSRIGS